jgi:hypothetical protein
MVNAETKICKVLFFTIIGTLILGEHALMSLI